MAKKYFHSIIVITIILLLLLLVSYTTNCSGEPLSSEEKEWLKQHEGNITFALETNYAPFAFVDKKGKSSGLATDYIKLIQKKLDFSLQEIKFNSFNEIVESAKTHKIDIVNAVTETENRSKYLLFTEPFIEVPNVIIVRKENLEPLTTEKLKSLKISTVKNYAITEYLSKNFPDLDIDLAPDDLSALLSVSFNRTDCAIIDLATASYLIDQKGITNLRVSGDVGYNIKLSIASRKDWPILNRILNKGLAAITPQEQKSIRTKWISINQTSLFKNRTFWRIIFSISLIFLSCFFAILLWNRTLKRQIFKHTNQLTLELEERKKAEEALQKSEEQYREYFEENLSGSYISTPDGQLVTCNRVYMKIFGFTSRQEALQTSIIHLYNNPDERDEFIDNLKKKRHILSKETTFKRIDGTWITVLENASGIFDKDGDLTHIRGFLLDVSEQKRLEAQIQQAQKMETIGTLAGGIAHDFNNILFPVVGHAEMLLEDIPSDSPFRGSLDEIYSSALRAKELVKQILTFSRQEKGEIRLFKIQPVIKEVLGLIRSTIPTTIDIVQNIQKDCGPIKADPTQIHQILMNLTTNAYHAMEASGGEMRIELREVDLSHNSLVNPDMKPGTYACLSIKDTGIGIKKETLNQIFDPFFTTKEQGKGTGLGLSVVHGIIKNLNGGIQVQSDNGKGTEFHIYFPVQKPTGHDEEQRHTPIIIGGNEHILLVDDETSIITMQQQLLTRLGYQITSFTNCFEALESFREHPDQYDLVITDLAMPKMSGDKFATELLKLKPDMKIILCTGFSDKVTPAYASDIGIKGLLEKPILKSKLAQKIREVLEN